MGKPFGPGVRNLFDPQLGIPFGPNWGIFLALSHFFWGILLALDMIEQLPEIDAKEVKEIYPFYSIKLGKLADLIYSFKKSREY